jgi:transposase
MNAESSTAVESSSSSSPAESSAAGSTPAEQSAAESSVGFAQLTHYCGFDWARDSHQVVVKDKAGTMVLSDNFADSAEGWARFAEKLKALREPATGGVAIVGVAIETCRGPAVERLLEMGLAVYPMNPKAAQRYRERNHISGAKSDFIDADSFSDALRSDGLKWRKLSPLDPLTHELRILCRDEINLIQQRTGMINQLRAALHEFYPIVLEAFDNWTMSAAWSFVVAFPTPQDLVHAGKRQWDKFMHTHGLYRPQMMQMRYELFAKATRFASPNGAVTRAKSLLATTLCQQLLTLQKQLNLYRAQIEKLFDDHPDHDLFGSLPGAGPKLAPRLLAEIGADRSVFASANGLQCYAGTAPVTRESGRQRFVNVRRACNATLRSTIHLWADLSRAQCAWAQAYYQMKKQQGMTHAEALRCLGQRWLKILWTMWQQRKPYDESRHTLNQIKHGSWVIKLITRPAKPTPA